MQFMKNVSIASQCSNYMYVKKSLENLHHLLIIFLKTHKTRGVHGNHTQTVSVVKTNTSISKMTKNKQTNSRLQL